MPRTLTNSQSDRGGLPPIDEEPFQWDGDGGGDGSPNDRGASRHTSMVGLVVMMSASVMTFAALASAPIIYAVRHPGLESLAGSLAGILVYGSYWHRAKALGFSGPAGSTFPPSMAHACRETR